LDAGVLDAPPKRPPELPVLPPAEPNRPPLAGVLDVLLFAVPKRDGVALPVEGAAPNSDLFGVLLPPLLLLLPCWPNVKLMMAVVVEELWRVFVLTVKELFMSARLGTRKCLVVLRP
jgi:hypothetical protein